MSTIQTYTGGVVHVNKDRLLAIRCFSSLVSKILVTFSDTDIATHTHAIVHATVGL